MLGNGGLRYCRYAQILCMLGTCVGGRVDYHSVCLLNVKKVSMEVKFNQDYLYSDCSVVDNV